MKRLCCLFLVCLFLVPVSFEASPQSSPPVMVGAGDIAVCTNIAAAQATATLLDSIPGTVFTLGDDAYPDGSDWNFAHCYDITWGRHRYRTKPTIGNHEYDTPDGMDYYNYYGTVAGTPMHAWYSYNLGTWHIIVLDSNCNQIDCTSGSPEYTWLQNDLAANKQPCTLSMWHHPLFVSNSAQIESWTLPFWQLLYNAKADLNLVAHVHVYERFAAQNPSGQADPNGMVEIVAGTGGESNGSFTSILPNSVVRNDSTYGVLQLTLQTNSYSFQFIPVAGSTFTDSGSGTCHK
jgi:hypothetical protein